jgi:hypothetical protein
MNIIVAKVDVLGPDMVPWSTIGHALMHTPPKSKIQAIDFVYEFSTVQ